MSVGYSASGERKRQSSERTKEAAGGPAGWLCRRAGEAVATVQPDGDAEVVMADDGGLLLGEADVLHLADHAHRDGDELVRCPASPPRVHVLAHHHLLRGAASEEINTPPRYVCARVSLSALSVCLSVRQS
eukprot:409300-Pyramimonas_sp.AAC.1